MAGHHLHPGLAVDTHSATSHPYWHEIRTLGSHPHRRSYHAAATWGNHMLICGGQDLREGMVPGLWVFSQVPDRPELDTWSEVPPSDNAPPPLCRSTAVVDQDRMVLFGGTDNMTESAATYILDLNSKTWSIVPPESASLPPPIDSHTAVAFNHHMFVFGGFIGGSRSNETFALDLSSLSWQHPAVTGTPPSPRSGHSAVNHEEAMFVFGGCNDEGTKLSDVWKLQLTNFAWERVSISEPPPGRSGHSACVYKSIMIVFGGMRDLTKETNEMYGLDLRTMAWGLIQEEKKIEDPVSAVQLEEYKKGRSPNHRLTSGHSSSPAHSASPNPIHKAKHESPTSPADDVAKALKKRPSHLYEGPPSPLLGRIVGRAPYPRDGHSAVLLEDKMFIFGGDRYQMPFNDLYVFAVNDHSLKSK